MYDDNETILVDSDCESVSPEIRTILDPKTLRRALTELRAKRTSSRGEIADQKRTIMALAQEAKSKDTGMEKQKQRIDILAELSRAFYQKLEDAQAIQRSIEDEKNSITARSQAAQEIRLAVIQKLKSLKLEILHAESKLEPFASTVKVEKKPATSKPGGSRKRTAKTFDVVDPASRFDIRIEEPDTDLDLYLNSDPDLEGSEAQTLNQMRSASNRLIETESMLVDAPAAIRFDPFTARGNRSIGNLHDPVVIAEEE